jgi:hypothetical protein
MKPAILLLALAALPLAADEFSRWTWRVPSPPSILFRKVIFAEDQFVAVGDVGAIMTSTNGTRWFVEESPATNRLQNIIFSGQYVASGDGGTVVVSPEARNWQLASFPGNNSIAALDHGNGIYVALDHQGNFFHSPNALAWSPVSTAARTGGTDMVFGGSLFVAVGPLGMILTSTNGLDWVERESGTTGALFSVAYGDERYVAVGAEPGGTGLILTSTDAMQWQLQLVDQSLEDVTFGDGGFVIVGGNFGGDGVSLTSGDGLYFESAPEGNGLNSRVHGVACGNGVCVAVGVGVYVSEDGGLTWTNVNTGPLEPMYSFARLKDTVVGVGANGTILTTTNGVDWADQQVRPDATWLGLAAGERGFVAVGNKAALAFSPDGHSWTSLEGIIAGHFRRVAYGGGVYVAVAGDSPSPAYGFFLTSTNGLDWEERRPFGQTYFNNSIAYGAGRFVAGGYDGRIYVSTDGTSWSPRQTGVNGSPYPVTFLGGHFLAFTSGGSLHSLDGLDWTFHPGETPSASLVAQGNGTYVAVSQAYPDALWSSPDGIHWRREKIGVRGLQSVIYAYDSFWVGGTVLQSQSSLVPEITQFGRSGGELNFHLFGRIGRDYELQSSPNLTDWEHEADYTQSARHHPLTLPTGPDQRFYRVKLKE